MWIDTWNGEFDASKVVRNITGCFFSQENECEEVEEYDTDDE